MKPSDLPSTFYRVTAKALIFDGQNRLLILEAGDTCEMPGGGWERDESFEACLEREIQEEVGVGLLSVGDIRFVYRAKSTRGYYTVRIVRTAELASAAFTFGDGMTGARFVAREEFLAANFAPDEAPIKDFVDHIWPPVAS